jgi:hypothetical protein
MFSLTESIASAAFESFGSSSSRDPVSVAAYRSSATVPEGSKISVLNDIDTPVRQFSAAQRNCCMRVVQPAYVYPDVAIALMTI